MIPLQRRACIGLTGLTGLIGLIGLIAAAACRGPGRPKLEATATWTTAVAPPGCERRLLHLDVATVAFMRVQAPGVAAKADEDGHVTLDVRQASLGRATSATLMIEGARLEVPLPPLGAPRPVAVGAPATREPAGTVVWRGRGEGAVVAAGLPVVEGVVDHQDLGFRLAGCDLHGGSVEGGGVRRVNADEVEVRVGLARRLATLTSLAPLDDRLVVDLDNADGAHGQVALTGTLDVAAALAAMQAAAGGARAAGAPEWAPGGANAILVTGPGLVDVARASKLLRGGTVGQAAGVLTLTIEQVPGDARCGADRTIPTTKARVQARIVARASGELVAERTFERAAACADDAPAPGGAASTRAAPPWDDILTWVEDVQQHAPAPAPPGP